MDQLIDFVLDEWLLFAILVIVLALIVRSFLAPKLSGAKALGVQELLRMTGSEDRPPVIVDVRTDKEFKEGHIANSIHIPVGALDSRIKELDKKRSSPIVINCQTGNRSLQGVQILKKHGFEDLYYLNGGMNVWINANLPIEKGIKKKK